MTRWKTDSEDTKVVNINTLTGTGKVLRKKGCASFSEGQVVSRMGSTGCEDVSSSIGDCTSTSGSSTSPLKNKGAIHNGKENEYDFDSSDVGNEAESFVPALRRASRPSTATSSTSTVHYRATSSSVSTSSDEQRPSNSGIPNRASYTPTDFLKDNDTTSTCESSGVASSVSDNERPSSSGIPNGAKVTSDSTKKNRATPSSSVGSVYGGDATYMNNFKAPGAVATPVPNQAVNSWGNTSNRVVLSQEPERPQGDVGLFNIGNTCFMGSGMQCLIHSPTLAEYFLKLDLSGLNLSASLVSEFQLFMQHAWFGITRAIYPTTFRSKLGEYHSQFRDGRQHDCQEFLTLTLDTLHEQLKSVVTKQIKMVNGSHSQRGDSIRNGLISAESEQQTGNVHHKRNSETDSKKRSKRLKLDSGRSQSPSSAGGGGGDAGHEQNQGELAVATRMAEDYWNNYMDKNNTVISNTFQGLFKSTVICAECSYVSVTYEPFMYLTIPIPRITSQNISVTFMNLKDRRPLKVSVSLLADETVERLKELVTREIPGASSDPSSLQNYVMVEVVNNNVARKLNEDMQIKFVNHATRNIYMYELNENFCENYGRCTNTGTLSGIFNNNHTNPIPMRTYTAVPHSYDETWERSPSPAPMSQELPTLVPNGTGTPDTTTSPVSSPGQADPLASTSTSGEVRVDTTMTDEVEAMDVDVNVESTAEEASEAEGVQSIECVICFDGFSYADALKNTVLKHKQCGTTMCEPCLQRAVAFNHKENRKRDEPFKEGIPRFLQCPICHIEVRDSAFVNFTSDEFNSELNLVAVLLRLPLDSNNNSSKNSGRLFGAPLVVRIPGSVAAEELYNFIAEINPFPELDSTLVKVKCDGNRCSVCCDNGCDGCVVEREGFVSILPGTALAISYTEITREQIGSVEPSDMASFSAGTMNFTPSAQVTPVVDIHDSLRAFSAVEHLDEQNPWHCTKCEKHQRATKTITICRFPDCLIIQLKRFVFVGNTNTSYKLSTKVRFPLNDLDMSPYIAPEGAVSSNNVYDLYSCVCHFGTLASGHYTAYSKNPVTHDWSYFNDSEVSTNRAPQDAEHETAYVLFFQRKGKGLRYDIPKRTEETIIRVAPSSIVNRPVAPTIPLPMPSPAKGGSILGTTTSSEMEEESLEGHHNHILPEPSYATTLDSHTTSGMEEMNFSGGQAMFTSFPYVSSSDTGSGLSPVGGGGFMTDDTGFEEDYMNTTPTAPSATLHIETEPSISQSEYADDEDGGGGDGPTSTQNEYQRMD